VKSYAFRKGLQIVGAFAGVGFILPWIFLAYYTLAHRIDKYPSTAPLSYLCPPSIISMGLDHASILNAILVWLFISLYNAVLYAIPGILTALVAHLWKSRFA
jgi:hypothetical protein